MSGTAHSTLTFLRSLGTAPLTTGAILPSGPILARHMAEQLDLSLEGPILELGPGTGVFTKALLERGIAPDRLVLIEYNPDFVTLLRRHYPKVTILNASAFDLADIWADQGLAKAAGIISGLPLLNFPQAQRDSLMTQCMDLLAPRAQMIQFTYAQRPPTTAIPGSRVRLAKRVWLNVPPASVWIYEPDMAQQDVAATEEDLACTA